MKIGVLGNPRYPDLEGLLARLHAVAPSLGFEILAESELSESFPEAVDQLDLEAARPEVILSFGGDGTLLRAARLSGSLDIPILGINLGRVGFLTACGPEEMEDALSHFAKGDYLLEHRRTLNSEIVRSDGARTPGASALNDVVVHKAGAGRVVSLEVAVDLEKVGEFSADGIIVCTPTGSTAYSLSAGGPVLVPTVEALSITLISAHTLGVRPIIVPLHASISITVVPPVTGSEVLVSHDGHRGPNLNSGDRVTIQVPDKVIRLVRLGTDDFFSRLRQKLHWGDLADRWEK